MTESFFIGKKKKKGQTLVHVYHIFAIILQEFVQEKGMLDVLSRGIKSSGTAPIV